MNKLTWSRVSLDDKLRLMTLYNQGLDLATEADALGMKLNSLERQIRSFREHRKMFLGEKSIQSFDSLPQPLTKQYTDFLVLDGDDWIVMSDLEIPCQKMEMLRLFLLTAMAKGIKKGIIAGDAVATDQQSLNSWVNIWRAMEKGKTSETTYEEDIAALKSLVKALMEWFDELYIIEGNHDDRIARKTGGEVHLGMFLEGTGAIYSRYAYMYLRTSYRGLIKVVHPQNFATDPVVMLKKLYAKERGPNWDWRNPISTLEKAHFLAGHCHIDQEATSPDGVYQLIGMGTMRDKLVTAYASQHENSHRQWDSSFRVIKNGFFKRMDLIHTDWGAELGDLYSQSPLANPL